MKYDTDIQNIDSKEIREYTGETDEKDRIQAVEWYNALANDDRKILVVSGVGGVGLDLKNTDALFILDPPWSPASEEQIIGRVARYLSHRTAPSNNKEDRGKVDVYKMRMMFKDESIISADDIIYKIINKKRNILDRIEELCKSESI